MLINPVENLLLVHGSLSTPPRGSCQTRKLTPGLRGAPAAWYTYCMADDLPATASTIAGTAPHQTLPNAPHWFGAILANPAQSIALLGVLALGGLQGADAIRGHDLEDDLQARLDQRQTDDAQKALLAQAVADAADCAASVSALSAQIQKLGIDADESADERIAFLGEIAQYLDRLASELTDSPPVFGPRLEEYVRKSLMRGYRER